MEQTHKRYTFIFGTLVFSLSFLGFLITASPTVAFWDCGEYIAAMQSLGVPHPPGNPLFMMMGRVASIVLGFLSDTGFRINVLVVLNSAIVALLLYLIVVRVMVFWVGIPDTAWKRIVVYLSAIVGAFYGVFNYTFWFSAVEASEATPSLVPLAFNVWLALKWSASKDPKRDRLLVLLMYVAFLSIGIHMTSVLSVIPVFLYVIMIDKDKLRDWRLWVVMVLMGSVIYNMSAFLWLGPITLLFTISMYFVEKNARIRWRFYFYIVFFALVGYSVHLMIPIRSALNPIIDENHPVIELTKTGKVEWEAFKGFLERKQYGSESMITRAFWRLGAFNKQFGIDGHMGYGGFHITQFFHFGRSTDIDRNQTVFQNWGTGKGLLALFIYMIPTFFMIYGWFYLYQKNRDLAILLIFLFLITSVLLVFYMNFADGTRPMKRDYEMWLRSGKQGDMPLQHREVRVRDYFFTGGFMFFGMWIGIAAGCLMHWLYTNKHKMLRQIAPIVTVLFAVSPALPFAQNFTENNRRNDYIPYDYAYNLLMSCDKDGILFTNGDNDTFPLWALQEGYGIRKDVRLVNLSLVNTKWYIKQLKNLEPKVPISYTDKEIDEKLNHQLNPIEKAINYKMRGAGIVVTLPGRDTKQALRVQDQMVINIVDSNRWKKPVYFAVTVSSDNLMGLQPYLRMEGLVYRTMPEHVDRESQVDIEKTRYFIDKVYRYRSLGDGSFPMSETAEKLMSNYAAAYIQIAITMREPLLQMKNEIDFLSQGFTDSLQTSDSALYESTKSAIESKTKEYTAAVDRVVNELDQCVAIMPWDWRPRMLREEVLMTHGRLDEAMKRIEEALKIEPGNKDYLKIKARLFDMRGEKAQANGILRKLAEEESDPWMVYSAICKNYEDLGLYDSALYMMQQFQNLHPGDRRAAAALDQFEQRKAEAGKTTK